MLALPLMLLAVAQIVAEPGADQLLSLRQISVTLKPGDAAGNARKASHLAQASALVTDCRQAADVAATLHAKVEASEDVPLSSLPQGLRDQLATQAIGTATKLFGAKDQYVRVLVLCGRRPA
jgi:peptidyl-prolyl cis-trans isomerase SurA